MQVRELLNRIAEKIRGRWIINRSTPIHDGAQKPDELVRTNQLYLSALQTQLSHSLMVRKAEYVFSANSETTM